MNDMRPPRFSSSDIVSGAFYCRLVRDFQAYEQKLRHRIRCLQTDIDFLLFENPDKTPLLEAHHNIELLKKEKEKYKQAYLRLVDENHTLRIQLQKKT